jgi:serine/threonine protein phosphatase PrpC
MTTMYSPAMTIASVSDIGDGQIQQDYVSISDDMRRIVLCDGHGLFGHDFAQATCDFMLSQKYPETRDPYMLFSLTNTHLKETMGDKMGGTTCTYVSFDSDKNMTVANVGDSSVRYWDSCDSGTCASTDHSPTRLDEFLRIRNAGGDCVFDDNRGAFPKGQQPVFLPCDFFFAFNASGVNYYKNCRKEYAAYFKSPCDTKRLAVTRSFGDWPLVPYGLITEPSVRMVTPSDATRSVVIASDGLWDVMLDLEIGNILRAPVFLDRRDALGAAAALLETALVAGRKQFGQTRDNITIVVAYV